jgi:3-phosphoinositide dependent protein kinase-1
LFVEQPENVLIGKDFHIKLTDFGTAKIEDPALVPAKLDEGPSSPDQAQAATKSFVGTAEYVSPELLNDQGAVKESDVWAIGCILFQLLCGRHPFKGANDYQTFQKVAKLDYAFPEGFPESAKDLLEQIFVLDPAKRITLADVKNHSFFTSAQFDWTDIWTQTPPTFAGNPLFPKQTPVKENKDNDAKSSPLANSPSKAGPEVNALETLSAPWKLFLKPEEYVLKVGHVIKRKGLSSKRRVLLLTTIPRLIYVDPEKMEIKGEIPWGVRTIPELKSNNMFYIHTPGRAYNLECEESDAKQWVEAINGQRSKMLKS